jgi:hypothetical protein
MTNVWLQGLLVAAWIVVAIALVAPYFRSFNRDNAPDWAVLALPVFFFGYLTLMVFTAVSNPSTLLVINTLVTAVVGLLLFAMPYSRKLVNSKQ